MKGGTFNTILNWRKASDRELLYAIKDLRRFDYYTDEMLLILHEIGWNERFLCAPHGDDNPGKLAYEIYQEHTNCDFIKKYRSVALGNISVFLRQTEVTS
jgi:hypothetical protein